MDLGAEILPQLLVLSGMIPANPCYGLSKK